MRAFDLGADLASESEAGNLQSSAVFRNLTSAFPHERGIVQRTFAGDDQIGGTQMPVQVRLAREQFKTGDESRAQKRQQAKAQPACRASTGNDCKVMTESPAGDPRQLFQAGFGQLEIFRAQSLLRSINPRGAAFPEQWILHIHGHDQSLEPAPPPGEEI